MSARKSKSKPKDWEQIYDGDWHDLDKNGKFTEVCCDCSLTHRVEIKVVDGKVKWRTWRDDKLTKKYRREFKNTAAVIP